MDTHETDNNIDKKEALYSETKFEPLFMALLIVAYLIASIIILYYDQLLTWIRKVFE